MSENKKPYVGMDFGCGPARKCIVVESPKGGDKLVKVEVNGNNLQVDQEIFLKLLKIRTNTFPRCMENLVNKLCESTGIDEKHFNQNYPAPKMHERPK